MIGNQKVPEQEREEARTLSRLPHPLWPSLPPPSTPGAVGDWLGQGYRAELSKLCPEDCFLGPQPTFFTLSALSARRRGGAWSRKLQRWVGGEACVLPAGSSPQRPPAHWGLVWLRQGHVACHGVKPSVYLGLPLRVWAQSWEASSQGWASSLVMALGSWAVGSGWAGYLRRVLEEPRYRWQKKPGIKNHAWHVASGQCVLDIIIISGQTGPSREHLSAHGCCPL